MMRYKNKRILIIGSSFHLLSITSYFHSEGAYLIYANKDASKKPFINEFDEWANIDDTNPDILTNFCKQNHVDSVISNQSELLIEIARIVNENIGNKYLFSKQQFNQFTNKNSFLHICSKYGIQTPKIYFEGDRESLKKLDIKKLKFPLVLKPIDSCGGRGCYLCKNIFEFYISVPHSFSNSPSGKIVAQEYIKGQEASLTFAFQNGLCKLIASTDRIPNYKRLFKNTVHSYFISPSVHTNDFLNNDFKRFENMFLDACFDNCSLAVQGFFKRGRFIPIEAALRYEGSYTYLFNSCLNKQNFETFCYDSICKVPTLYDINKDTYLYKQNKKALLIGIFLKGGTIKSIKGYEVIQSHPSYLTNHFFLKEGSKIDKRSSFISHLLTGFYFTPSSKEEIKEIVKLVKRNLKVIDTHNRNMIRRGPSLKRYYKYI